MGEGWVEGRPDMVFAFFCFFFVGFWAGEICPDIWIHMVCFVWDTHAGGLAWGIRGFITARGDNVFCDSAW